MRTVDKGFKAGDKATPESFNIWANKDEIVEVIEVSAYSMLVKHSNDKTEWVAPFRWAHIGETK